MNFETTDDALYIYLLPDDSDSMLSTYERLEDRKSRHLRGRRGREAASEGGRKSVLDVGEAQFPGPDGKYVQHPWTQTMLGEIEYRMGCEVAAGIVADGLARLAAVT